MAMKFFPTGLSSLANGTIDFDTDTINIALLDLDGSPTDVGVLAITNATNASPIVCTVADTTGMANEDLVIIRGVGGNTAANGTWRITVINGTTFSLHTVRGSLASTGNGAYTSGGCIINLSLGDDFADLDACSVGTPVALGSKTVSAGGVLDAADPTFSAFTGSAHAFVIYESGGKNLFINDGRTQVVVAADAASSATTIWVEPLEGDLASGITIVFSNGITATLSSGASAGARSIAVNALSGAIAAGHHGDAVTTNSGLPLTAASNGVTITFPATGIATLQAA